MANKKSVSIIIPNYNGDKLLKEYLPYAIDAIENAEIIYSWWCENLRGCSVAREVDTHRP